MEIWYYIKTDNGWTKTDYDTYHSWTGKKETRGPTYGLAMLQRLLVTLRW